MRRRRFTREFKVEAVKLVRERGVSVAQAGRDLDVHENVLRKWIKEFGSDPAHARSAVASFRPDSNSSRCSGSPYSDPILSHCPPDKMPCRVARSRASSTRPICA